MTFLKTTIAALVATSSAGYAQAQDSGAYGGLGVSAYVTNPDNAIRTELFAVEAKLGYNFNKYFGVEGQGSVGLNTDSRQAVLSFTGPPTTFRTKVDYSVGAFAVARLPITKRFEVFARGGVHNTQVGVDVIDGPINVTTDSPVTSLSETETGFAFGAGTQFNFDKKNAIRADYTYLDGTNAETLSLGYVRKF